MSQSQPSNRSIALSIGIAAILFLGVFAASPLLAVEVVYAPFSEDFEKFSGDREKSTEDGSQRAFHGVSHLDLSHLRNADRSSSLSQQRGASLPRRYDLRTYGWTTPAKVQTYNNCWAYSACASLESAYLRKTGTALDLSETHLSWFSANGEHTFSRNFKSGGYDNIAVAMLARWSGAVLEKDAPENTEPSGSESSYKNRLHLESAFFLGLQFNEEFDRPSQDVMKRLVYEHGGISVGICMATDGGVNRFYNESTNAWFYNSAKRTRPDHAVLLVGWDDDYSRYNFREDNRPKSNGAWLARNHRGQNFGDKGFFWVSYEDVSFGDGTAFVASDANNFDKNYGYDELGWCISFGDEDSETIWLANVFSSGRAEETLEAVSFYTTDNGARYAITIYTDLADRTVPSSGKAAASQSGTREFAGYHTVRLSSPVSLPAGSRFAVAVKMTTPGYNFPGAAEKVVKGYSDNAVVRTGESFISSDGKKWSDAKQEMNANVCVRAFTKLQSTPDPDPDPTPDNGGGGGGGCSAGSAGFAGGLLLLAGCVFIRRR